MDDLTIFERDLSARLQAHLGPRRPVNAHAIALTAVAGSGARSFGLGWRPSVAPMQRLAWLALVGLTLVALLALAIGVGRERPRPTDLPRPSQPLPSNPAVVVPVASPADASAYVALFMRADDSGGADLFAALPDGNEQLLRHFATLAASKVETILTADHWDMSPYAQISSTGWLAMQVTSPSDAYGFFDLKDPNGTPWLLPYWAAVGGAWSPSGLFAALEASATATLIVDPEAHTATHLSGSGSIGSGPTVYWAADSSGVLGHNRSTLGVFPADGSRFAAGLPRIADRRGGRPFGAAGTFLCGFEGAGIAEAQNCSEDKIAVDRLDTGRPATEWSDLNVAAGTIQGAAFTADGSALWALATDNASDQPLSVLRLDAPNQPQIVTKVDRSALPEPRAATLELGFSSIAPDDSIMVIGQGFSLAGVPQLAATYVATDGSGAYPHFGLPVGFVRGDVLDSWFSSGSIATPAPRPTGPVAGASSSPIATPAVAVPALIPIASNYAPLVVRFAGASSFKIAVVDANGAARDIYTGSVAPDLLDKQYGPSVSVNGWLRASSSVATTSGYVDTFTNLNDPLDTQWSRDAKPQGAGPGWGPNGLLATDNGNLFIDPRTQATWRPSAVVFLGGGPILIWSADGVGVYNDDPEVGIQPLDGSPFVAGLRQSWSLRGSMPVGADGAVLCRAAELFGVSNPDCSTMRVGVITSEGVATDWGETLPVNSTILDASFSPDGQSVYVTYLLPGPPPTLRIARIDGRFLVRGIAILEQRDVSFPITADAAIQFAGLSPDGSVVAITAGDLTAGVAVFRADELGYTAASYSGALAGFVPGIMAAGWPTVTP